MIIDNALRECAGMHGPYWDSCDGENSNALEGMPLYTAVRYPSESCCSHTLDLQAESMQRGLLPINLLDRHETCVGLFDPKRQIDVVATELVLRLNLLYGEEFNVRWTAQDRYAQRVSGSAYFEGLALANPNPIWLTLT